MHKAFMAERMLNLVTSPSYASSIVGDLLEEDTHHSSFCFWIKISKITISHLLQTFQSRWLRMIWLAFSGFLLFDVFPLLLIILSIFVLASNRLDPIRYLKTPIDILTFILPILAGRNVAKRSQGSEVAAGVSLASLVWAYTLFLALNSADLNQWGVVLISARGLLDVTAIIAAAIWMRYRSNSRDKNAAEV